MTAAELERFLHEQIPLSKLMGVRVESADAAALVLTAPLEVNHNHLGTAFGGSLGAVAVLAGYAYLWLRLEDRGAHIVVRRTSMDYQQPVTGKIRAVCGSPGEEAVADFRKRFEQKGKARVTLRVEIAEGAAIFEGVYVAVKA